MDSWNYTAVKSILREIESIPTALELTHFLRIFNPHKACGRCGPNSLDLTNLGVMNNQIWMQISPDIQAADKEYESMND